MFTALACESSLV
uniref:Uncharacterized protein n=1 Tax=Arundo donax TaxID=35708 RepID=A0A0A9C2X8_ARUDO